MKKWIMWIFNINKELDKLCEKIEKRIHKLSLNSVLPATEIYKKVIELNNKKNGLINLRVLYNVMAEVLSGEELAFLSEVSKMERYIKGAQREKRGQMGELNRLICVCRDAAVKAGFSTKRFERDYNSVFAPKIQTN